MRQILVNIWQGKLDPNRALKLLQRQQLVRAGPFSEKEEELILGVLEALQQRILTTNEAEEEIIWILNNRKKEACQI